MSEENKLPEEAIEAINAIGDDTTEENTPPVSDDNSADGDSAAGAPAESSEEGSGDSPENWWNDGDLAYAQSYALTEEDLKGFPDSDSFRQATKLFDRNLSQLNAGQQQVQENQPESAKPDEAHPEFKRVTLDPDEVDESTVAAFNQLQDQLEAVYKANSELRQQQQDAVKQQEEAFLQQRTESFYKTLDEIGASELFGTDGNRNTLQEGNVYKLWSDAHALEQQAQTLGQRGSFDSFVKRTFALSFEDQHKQQQQAQQSAKILKQSQQRLGGGQSTSEPPKVWDGDPEKDPYLHDAYDRMLNETGQRH